MLKLDGNKKNNILTCYTFEWLTFATVFASSALTLIYLW